MPTGNTLALRTAKLTPQQSADMALAEDQAARRAIARGDYGIAAAHILERNKLLDWEKYND